MHLPLSADFHPAIGVAGAASHAFAAVHDSVHGFPWAWLSISSAIFLGRDYEEEKGGQGKYGCDEKVSLHGRNLRKTNCGAVRVHAMRVPVI